MSDDDIPLVSPAKGAASAPAKGMIRQNARQIWSISPFLMKYDMVSFSAGGAPASAGGAPVFACYGPKDKIRFFDQCGCRCHQCAYLDGRASLSDMEDEAICGGGIRNSTRANARRFATSTQLDAIDAEEATRGQ